MLTTLRNWDQQIAFGRLFNQSLQLYDDNENSWNIINQIFARFSTVADQATHVEELETAGDNIQMS